MRKSWLHLRPGSHPHLEIQPPEPPTSQLTHRLFRSRSSLLLRTMMEVLHHKAARYKRLKTRGDCEETLAEEMSYPSDELMEHIPYVSPLHGLPFHLDAAYLEAVRGQRSPYRRLSYLPFRVPLGVCEYSFEPAFIRKRNERERHRVRCVNEGYARLREHLPQEFEDKRLSKVETLRAAIEYIKHLQSLLDFNATGMETPLGHVRNGPETDSDGESKTGLSDSGDTVY